jgi:hypothetical protein
MVRTDAHDVQVEMLTRTDYRLDVDIPGLTSSNALELLETVSHLGHLRVLGFDLRSISDEDDIPVLAAYLSPSLTALHLQIAWENTLFSSRELVDLVRTPHPRK